MDTATPPSLEYAAAPRSRRRLRRIIFIFLAVILGIACIQLLPKLLPQIRYRFITDQAQRALLHYAEGPDRVVHEEDPANVASLLRLGFNVYHRAPRLIDNRDPLSLAAAQYWPSQIYHHTLPNFGYPTVGDRGVYSGGIAFAHGLDAGLGERLVVIEVVAGASVNNGNRDLLLYGHVFKPGNAWRGVKPKRLDGQYHFVYFRFPPSHIARLFTGQLRSDKRASFTIAYEIDGQPGVIDCWLGKDDRVGFRVRSGPLQHVEFHQPWGSPPEED